MNIKDKETEKIRQGIETENKKENWLEVARKKLKKTGNFDEKKIIGKTIS